MNEPEKNPKYPTAISQSCTTQLAAVCDESTEDWWGQVLKVGQTNSFEKRLEGTQVIFVVGERRLSEAAFTGKVIKELRNAPRERLTCPSSLGPTRITRERQAKHLLNWIAGLLTQLLPRCVVLATVASLSNPVNDKWLNMGR
jgi:hypothetical protein